MDLIPKIVTSDKYRFVYREIPKVATRSMLYYFVRHPAMDYGAVRSLVKPTPKGYFNFAFVRNPFDRVASAYAGKITSEGAPHIYDKRLYKDMPFMEFVDYICGIPDTKLDIHLRSQYTFTRGCDFVGHFESLPRDFDRVLKRLGLTPYQLPHKNTSRRTNWEDYYTAETFDKIANRFKKDIKLFGYENLLAFRPAQ